MSKSRARFVALEVLLARRHLDVDEQAIKAGRVLVDGRVVSNPAARVRADASVRVQRQARLRGDVKLSYALDRFRVPVADRVAADVGASAGGFTTALLDRGARRVYAIDVGVGQLVGRLRVDDRVVNLEGHNVGSIDRRLVPERVDIVTIDLSYLAVADALPQIEALDIAGDADLVALVKPMFELRRARPPARAEELQSAVRAASEAVASGPWIVVDTCESGVTGARGTTEFFIHATRATGKSHELDHLVFGHGRGIAIDEELVDLEVVDLGGLGRSDEERDQRESSNGESDADEAHGAHAVREQLREHARARVVGCRVEDGDEDGETDGGAELLAHVDETGRRAGVSRCNVGERCGREADERYARACAHEHERHDDLPV